MNTLKTTLKFIIIITSLCLIHSCASILSGSTQKVNVNTLPSGARVFVNGEDKHVLTPATIKVPRKKSVTYTFQKQGYEDGKVTQSGSFNGTVVANLLIGGVIGGAIDYATGAWYKLPKQVNYSFDVVAPYRVEPANDVVAPYRADPTIRAGEATNMVSRDNPGGTSLERTILRWHFDSDPRGARVFWRVISSVPDQVKNTNESYLSATPFEETRSFNILGLTYENSRDVTIEVKVTKRGYMDQVKRYNVRQAIDQQEISGFFELVEE